MTDSMKFGPEWLRNLSSEGNTSSTSGASTRYHLAEHRYGREEMLALFEQSLKLRPPASMLSFKTLYVDQALNPLALAPMTEDENRLWTGRTVPPGAARGRGGSMDRGRGRGRGGTFHPGFNRSNSAYDESTRPFERNQTDRGWSERNGELGDWGAGTSPRKDYSSSRGASVGNDNWRRHRISEDGTDLSDGWRTANHRSSSLQDNNRDSKWGSTGAGAVSSRNMNSNWRDGDARGEEHLSDRQANNRVSWHSSGDNGRNSSQRRMFDSIDDHLPEWATENPSESGGSFDASGAFHGSDDEILAEKGSKSKSGSSNTSSGSTLQKSASQQNITALKKPSPLSTSQSATNLIKKQNEDSQKDINNKIKDMDNRTKQDVNDKIEEDKNNKTLITGNKEIQKKPTKEIQENKLQHNIDKEETFNNSNDLLKKNNQQQHHHQQQLQQQNNPANKIFENQIHINKKADVDEFDHMKEVTDDIVAKLILDDEIQPTSKSSLDNSQQNQQQQQQQQQQVQQRSGISGGNPGGVAPLQYPGGIGSVLGAATSTALPPPPGSGAHNDKWFYRDPQGEVQGPFTAQEMSDWFRAGYFTVSLLVRRHIDERYFTLGDLVKQCPGSIPFLTCRLPPLKAEMPGYGKVAAPESDPVQQMHMQRLLQRHAEAIRTLSQTEPWQGMSHIQQRELVTQHMMQQPQVLSDLPFIPPISNTQMSNPLMHMISQMQQANKLPVQPNVVEKPPSTVNSQHLDPLQQLVQQMGGLQPNIPPTIQPMGPTQPSQNSVPQDPSSQNQKKEDPIQSLIRQLANQSQRDYWTIRNPQPQFPNPATSQQPPAQWLTSAQQISSSNTNQIPHSMWDLHQQSPAAMPQPPQSTVIPTPQVQPQNISVTAANMSQQQMQQQQIPMPPSSMAQITNNQTKLMSNNDIKDLAQERQEEQKKKAEAEKEQRQKERKEQMEREKRRKEQEQLEKAKQQKDLEEKRKEEQRKLEAAKKAEAEKQKKEEEKIRKELEKAKREAEEKRLRELEEKRKLKEQRKAEEEARKKLEEERKLQEEENKRKEQEKLREEQSRRQAEALRKMQEQQQRTKVAPWCQTATAGPQTSTSNLSLAEIQRAEREKRAAEAAIVLQQQKAMAAATKELQEQQAQTDKSATMLLKWASKKPVPPKKVKSLAEIQAEEQERVAKQLAEQRLAQQQKEKELAPIASSTSTSIWSSASQSLTWNTNNTSGATPTGFWDEQPNTVQQQQPKIRNTTPKATVTNNSSQPINNTNNSVNNLNNNNKATQKQTKNRAKKEEETVRKLFDKNAANNDEFTSWCMKTLASLNSDVDIPTFVGFLCDIESPYEIKDYVRQYLGDSTQALHFANQFVERRSKVKDLERAALQHKDDLCMPAPAINPSAEFQEVKGRGKKTKKSKMTKVDNRILGFSVTAAENRINVGDRDYGDI